MHGPGFVPRPTLVEWMTLVARHVRSSTDPGPALAAGGVVERVAISGECDIFLLPIRLGPALRPLSAPLHIVSGAGHLLAEEQPEAVAELAVRGR